MKDREDIQRYINNFRRRFSTYLGKGIGASILIYPSSAGGAVLEIKLGANEPNNDEYLDVTPTVNDALKGIEQNAFGGNLDGFRFGGTNIIMEPARIVLLKSDDSEELWSDEASDEDVQRIIKSVVTPQAGGVAI